MPENKKWELKLHDASEDPYFEITNGQTSICAHCGFVGETDEEENAIFQKVVDTLNESGIYFHSENILEFKQHIEIMQLQSELEHWKTEHQELREKSQKTEAVLNLELKQKTKALERFVSMHETGLLPNRFVYENGRDVLAEWKREKEVDNA